MTTSGCGSWSRRLPIALLSVLLAAIPASAQKPADVAQKDEALAAARKAYAEAEHAARATYDAMERSLAAARGDGGAAWKAEVKRTIEGLSAAAVAAAQKRGSRQQVQAIFKREGPVALKKIELKDLAAFESVLAARLNVVGAEVPLDASRLEAGALAEFLLERLLGSKPFHEFWNETLADALPAADAYRKAFEAMEKARWDVEIAKDPVLQWQKGAPSGFARVPAGSYYSLGNSGFGAQGSRKGKKPVSVARDVWVGIFEVTHAEFFEWWKGLDAEAKKKHLPSDASGQPFWPTPDGAPGPEVPPDLARKPVTGITLVTALAYAAHRGARLPTEAEWCATAGGRDGRLYPWGEAWQPGQCNDIEHKVNDLLDVGTLPGRGPFGHQDLAGNAAEWTATYEAGKEVDPAKVDDANAVVRGGSYAQSREEVSNGWVWYRRALFDRHKDLGFRLAIDTAKK